MFEDKRVREFAAFVSDLKGVNVEVKEVPSLGGLACVCSLDESVRAAFRPYKGFWKLELVALDARGKKSRETDISQMQVGLNYDYLAVFMLFCLANLGNDQLEVVDGELVPTDFAYDGGKRKTVSQWEDYMENWQFCMFHIYAKANELVPAPPGNAASEYMNSNEFARNVWVDMRIDPKVLDYFLSTVYERE